MKPSAAKVPGGARPTGPALRPPAVVAVLGAVGLALGLAACGGGSHTHAAPTRSLAAQAPVNSTASTAATTAPRRRSKPKAPRPKARAKTTRTSSSRSATHPAATTHATTGTRSSSATTPTYTRPLHATLVGESHHPIANRSWSYTVTATDAAGRPLPGTVETEFTFNGVVVGHETPPTHPLTHGRLHDSVTFPPAAVGHPLDLQVIVRTPIGSVTLDWFVEVRSAPK